MIQKMSLCMFQDKLPVLSLNTLNAKISSELLHKDPIETCFVSALDRGGLQLPSSILFSYVESAFCCIEYLETKMLATKLPFKLLICSLLKVLSNQWDTTFSCA